MITRYTLLLVALLWPLALMAQQTPPGPRYTLFRPVPRSQMRPLTPDRPGVTESPFTLDAGHFMFESDLARYIGSRPGATSHTRSYRLDALSLKLGLSDQTDLQLFVDPYVIEKQWPDGGGPPERQAGFGDITVRVKRNLIGNDSTRGPLALGLIGYVLLPTGKKVGEGGLEYGLLVPATYALSDNWNLSGQLASRLNYDREASQHYVELAPSLNLDHSFRPWLTGFVEAVTIHDFREPKWSTALNFGPVFLLGKNAQLDVGRHLALTREADREYFVGLVLRR
ncbi:transporter [Hymenobacter taeanensis]|uniref:Transporter n=1 Tax=Hymenobacter taeanensis TaxID=2735321 RepID=A0A6M6BDD5_9BACT|nr:MULTISPECIES: transporter [Hymenobacter]QJX46237.1 transporter [Hymenobacter taeanensis]UOQ80090.1 transporter [Hymenobacter sp. 5414T-23]